MAEKNISLVSVLSIEGGLYLLVAIFPVEMALYVVMAIYQNILLTT